MLLQVPSKDRKTSECRQEGVLVTQEARDRVVVTKRMFLRNMARGNGTLEEGYYNYIWAKSW